LKERRVRFTAIAEGQVRQAKLWWLQNRIHQDVFTAEFEEALRILAVLPSAGTPYPQANIIGLRRLYLRKVAAHLYYTFDEDEVIIRSLWGARRREAPSFSR
jgi:hypothetical protein